jgi:hypothetical protein
MGIKIYTMRQHILHASYVQWQQHMSAYAAHVHCAASATARVQLNNTCAATAAYVQQQHTCAAPARLCAAAAHVQHQH